MNHKLSSQTIEIMNRLIHDTEIEPECVEDAFASVLEIENEDIRNVLLGSYLIGFLVRKPNEQIITAMLKKVADFDNYNYLPHIELAKHFDVPVISIMGSGKKSVATINVSTCAAFVAATLGAHVLKAGSFATSSKAGSADFFQRIGVNVLSSDPVHIVDVMKDTNIAFYNIELSVPKFNKIYGGKLFTVNALSLGLAPMLNPFICSRYIYGFSSPEIASSYQVLSRLGRDNSVVYSCKLSPSLYLDEILPIGQTVFCTQNNSSSFYPTEIKEILKKQYLINDFTQCIHSVTDTVFEGIKTLMGKGMGILNDIVALNASQILFEADLCTSLEEGYHMAKAVLIDGAAYETLRTYVLGVSGSTLQLEKYVEWSSKSESIRYIS